MSTSTTTAMISPHYDGMNLEKALDWLFLELCEGDPPESEWQVGYEAALSDFFSLLLGRDPKGSLRSAS